MIERTEERFGIKPGRLAADTAYGSAPTLHWLVDKQIAPDTLDVIVPSMLLQPLVENSIKHGLSRKVGGGRITIRTALKNGRATIEVLDDGLGMTEERLQHAVGDGIGLSNVNERLRTIYGAACTLKLTSEPGRGTSVSVDIPELTVSERVTA